MIELTFAEFHEQCYDEQQYCLYAVKNRMEDVLYVGISTNNVWERWFGWGGHITWDGQVIYGESAIGIKIEEHLPDSLNWKIQLWNLKDCLEFCSEELPANMQEMTIHDLEPIMIQKLSPILNAMYNLKPGKDTTPKSQKELSREKLLNRVYKEAFNKE